MEDRTQRITQSEKLRDKRLKKKKRRGPQGPVGLYQKKTYDLCHQSPGRIGEKRAELQKYSNKSELKISQIWQKT